MPKTTIEFEVNDRRARAGFDRLQRELSELNAGIGNTARVSETARTGFQQVGQSAGRAGGLVDQFGKELKTTQRNTQETAGELDRLQKEFRELQAELQRTQEQLNRVQRNTEGSTATTRKWGISLGSLKGVLAGLGIAAVSSEILQFARASAQASIQIDSYTRALEVLEGSALVAENRIRRLQDLADLPGLRFKDAVEGSLALKAVRVEAELATRVLTELGNAAAFTGGQGEFQRGLLGLRQIVARGRISQEELNQLTENISVASTVLRNQFGTVLAEDIQKILDETGQDVNDFLETLISGFEKIERFPIDAPSVKLKNLSNSFFEFQAALGDTFLPTIAAGAQGLTALFDTLGEGVTAFNNFFDVVDEEHQALLNASESAREFSIRLKDINEAAGQREAVASRIQHLYRLRAAYRTEQSELAQGTQAYLDYARQIREVNTELDTLRTIQGTGTGNNAELIAIRTDALQRANADIERYTQLLANARAVAVGDTNPAIQQLERSLSRSQATVASLQREIELLTDGFKDVSPATEAAVQDLTNYSLALAELKATAEDAYQTLSNTAIFSPQLTPNFQSALAASNAYYTERIRQAEAALAKEKESTEEYNTLETRIFELRRQRLQEETRLQQTLTRIRIERSRGLAQAEQNALKATGDAYREYLQILSSVREIQQGTAFRSYVDQLRQQRFTFEQILPRAREYLEFLKQIAEIPRVGSPEAQFGNFSGIIQDSQTATENVKKLSDALLELTGITAQLQRLDLDVRIPDPGVRQQDIDEQIAARNAQGGQTLDDIQIEAYQQGLSFIRRLRSQENADAQRELQISLREQERYYRQFANTVSSLFTGIATGRIQGFEEVARQFIAQSLQIVSRAFIEYQIQKRLDDQLTASKIANAQKVNAAQTAGTGAGGIGSVLSNLPGLGNLGNLGNLFSGGGLALGVSALLFPDASRNLLSGIRDELSGFVENVRETPVVVEANIENNLRIGENGVREISDIQATLVEEERA